MINKRVVAGALVCLLFGAICFSQTKGTDSKILSVSFKGPEKTVHMVVIRTSGGEWVRCIPADEISPGKYEAAWDGNDYTGRQMRRGIYKAYVSTGISWELDRSFGYDGRIGPAESRYVVSDPSDASFKVPGAVYRMMVNSHEYERAYDFASAETTYMLEKGCVTVNPARLNKADTITISYYRPCFLENPWDMAVAPDGSLFILLRWRKMWHGLYPGSLVKLKPDGRTVDTSFGVDGEIPWFHRASQVILAPLENRLYIAGSAYGTYGTGSYKLDTGAYWFYIGGHWDNGRDPATTWWPSGICLGEGTKIYIGDLKVYDRTKPMKEGFLYSANVKTGIIRPGPSMEKAPEPDMFYLTGWTTGISKMKDIGTDVKEEYSLILPHRVIGISLDARRRFLFAGSRMPDGFVSVLYDNGTSIKEITRLEDKDLAGIHTVRYHDGYLYVVEDSVSFTEGGYCAEEMNMPRTTSIGKNRVSRYVIRYGREQFLADIEKR